MKSTSSARRSWTTAPTVGLTVELEAWNISSRVSPATDDRRSLPVRLRRLGPRRVRFARRRDLPYVLRCAVGVASVGVHSAQPSTGPTRRHREQQGLRAHDRDDHTPPVAGREPHQLLHAALRGPADRCRLRAEDQRSRQPGRSGRCRSGRYGGICGFNDATNINNCPTTTMPGRICSTSAPTT